MRLLLVEDEPDLLSGLARALRRQAYQVDTAVDGHEGLYKAQAVDYDAILLDVMLPGLDGWAVLKALRLSKATPVLMLTARDKTADRVRGLDGGADDYLVKPFDLEELFARVRALIRRGAQKPSPELVVADVTIDLAAKRASLAGNAVTLTAREYAILEYLMLHRGALVSRTELYEHVVDETDDTLSNLIDVHISNLRKKLGHGFITTRRGQGYCIE